MQSAYDAFQEGNRLLASQNPHAAVIPLERARDLEPDKGSVRETLARAYFRTGRFTQAERGVRARGRDRAGERLRPLRARPVPDAPGRPHRRPPPPQAGGGHAARPARLPGRAGARRRRRVTGAAGAPVVACDLDGVIWRGDEPDPARGRRASPTLRAAGLRVAFVSNNSNSPVDRRGRQARPHGRAGDAPTTSSPARWRPRGSSPQSLARRRPRARVRRPGGAGGARRGRPGRGRRRPRRRRWWWASTGSSTTTASTGRRPRCAAGARFVATNLDATYPVPGGLIPGAGALVAAVATAAGRRPEVAGKPEAPTVGIIRERFGTSGVVVGDRPSTDGALATALGWPFALVLSGVTAAVAPPGGEAIPEPPPPFVVRRPRRARARVDHLADRRAVPRPARFPLRHILRR